MCIPEDNVLLAFVCESPACTSRCMDTSVLTLTATKHNTMETTAVFMMLAKIQTQINKMLFLQIFLVMYLSLFHLQMIFLYRYTVYILLYTCNVCNFTLQYVEANVYLMTHSTHFILTFILLRTYSKGQL